MAHNFAVVLARLQSLLKDLWNAPGQIKRDCPEYHECLATSIVALAPLAPHFSAELWRGLSEAKGPRRQGIEKFDFDKNVFEQVSFLHWL